MTISTTQSSIQVAGDGVTTSFAFPFVAVAPADITVTSIASNGAQIILTSSQYTLTINSANPNQLWGIGGNVSFSSPRALGTSLLIQRTLPLTQITSVQNQGNYYSQVTEQALDILCMEIQQIAARTTQFRGTWATGIVYNFGDIVQDGTNGNDTLNYYICTNANTSGVWATDLAAGDWAISVLATVPATNQVITFTGAISGSGTTSIATGINANQVTNSAIASGAVTVSKISQISAGNYLSNYTASFTNAGSNPIPPLGQCQLQLSSSTQIVLMPFKGNQVSFPNGYIYKVPSTGLLSGSVAGGCNLNGVGSSTLSATTLYYVYLWYNAGTPALDFSVTGHSTDATTGIEIKTGDNTRVLVGMVYTQAGPTVSDSGANRLVASWHNRQPKNFTNVFTTDRTTTSASFVEINSEIRCQFVGWGDGAQGVYSGSARQSADATTVYSGISIDGAVTAFAGPIGAFMVNGSGPPYPVSVAGISAATEGFHFLTVFGAVSSGTGTWFRAANSTVSSGLNGQVII